MNLYYVTIKNADWCCFVFAPTLSIAKKLFQQYGPESMPEWTDIRANLVKKDVGGQAEVCDENCDRLKALGVTYRNDEEGVL